MTAHRHSLKQIGMFLEQKCLYKPRLNINMYFWVHDTNNAPQGWAENSTPVFTRGIYWYLPAWQIRLKWQILANNGKYNFLGVTFWQI